MWDNVLRSSAISLGEYGSKIRKVNRCRPRISNGTILATKQALFLSKLVPIQSITDIALLVFSISTAPLYFILHYHLFFRKEFSFLLNVYISLYFSEYDIRMLLQTYKLTAGRSNLNVQHEVLCLRDSINTIYCKRKSVIFTKGKNKLLQNQRRGG